MVFQRHPVTILLVILLVGLVPRLFSVHWNSIPHADVRGDALASASFQREGRLITSDPSDKTQSDEAPSGLETSYLILHPPVWPMLGAAVNILRGQAPSLESNYLAFRILSLLVGMLVIVLSFLVGTRLVNEQAGLAAALFVACSALMIDYSGNGAFYGAQAALYLLWILIALRRDDWRRAVLLGLLTGAAYMVNFQTITLIPASVIVLLSDSHGRAGRRVGFAAIASAIPLLIALPWFLRNAALFSDPFMSQHMTNTYIFDKSGFAHTSVNGIPVYAVHLRDWIWIAWHNVLLYWLPNNLYYVARKLFILAPVAFFLFSYAIVDYLFSWKRVKRVAPLLLILGLHLFVAAAWPVTKFRYFVPMLPLVFLVAVDQLFAQRWSSAVKNLWIGATFASLVALAVLTYRAIPTHTYYFDGAITTDPFSGSQEMDFVRQNYPALAPHP